jgi:hypothetical protein
MQFLESFGETSPTNYYLYIAKAAPWNNEASPPSIEDTYQRTYYDDWRNMISLKRVQASDVCHVATRYNWAANNVYDQWDDNDSLQDTQHNSLIAHNYYVLTDDNNVYKCIDNNQFDYSTIKPTGTSVDIISTPDKYKWKYLYTVTAADALKFLTPDWIPVRTLSSNNGSSQWSVQQTAANGAIHQIVMSNTGSGYLTTSNTFASVVNSSVMVLKGNASGIDGVYTGSAIFIESGAGSGQLRSIIRYVGSSRTLTVNTAFSSVPNTTSQYLISPRVIVRGDSGRTESERASAYVSNCFGGLIREVTMKNVGSGYSQANVTFVANGSYGINANGYVIIAPRGGHGADPVDELRASNIMINVKLSGGESNTFPTNNDFRIIGLVRDPLLANGAVANASVIDQSTRVSVVNVTGDFTADEIIVGGESGAKARNIYFANTNTARTRGIIKVNKEMTNGIGQSFLAGETVTGSLSGVTAEVVERIGPALQRYTGFIIYTETRSAITRAPDQIEDIKVVVQF